MRGDPTVCVLTNGHNAGPLGTLKIVGQWLLRQLFAFVRMLPGAQAKIDKELGKVLLDIETKLLHAEAALPKMKELPAQGFSEQQVLFQLSR